jgi:hypothetical protein
MDSLMIFLFDIVTPKQIMLSVNWGCKTFEQLNKTK